MKKILILIAIFFLSIVSVSCGGDDENTGDTGDMGNLGDPCIGSDKFCHSHDGLNWADALISDRTTWGDAVEYCKNLGGRLPTISELRTLIQNCPATETGGKCGVTDSCLSSADCWNDPCAGCENNNSGKYSVFGDTYYFWSSSEQSENTDYAWYVDFYEGGVYISYEANSYGDVRCVR
jgi:uncharacterized protein (TIGR02145 family)